MLNRRTFFAALLAAPLLLAGCKVDTINSFPSHPAHVRAVNLLADVPTVNVAVGGNTTWPGLGFESATGYQDFNNVRTSFAVTVPGSSTSLSTGDFDLAGEQSYTLAVYGDAASPSIALLADSSTLPNAGNFQVRLINTAISAGNLDVYVTPPGFDISTISATSVGIIYGSSTNLREFSTGTYQVRVTQNGTLNVIYDSGPVTFADRSVTNIFFDSRSSGVLANAAFVPITTGGVSGPVNSTLTRLRLVNGAYQTGDVNAFIDGNALSTVLPYAQASLYNVLPPGGHTVTFEAASVPGAPIATAQVQLAPASDASLVVYGAAGSTSTILLQDSNAVPASNVLNVRYVNASQDAPPLNVVVNGVTQVTALASGKASNYVSFAGGVFNVTFNDATTGATLLTLSNVGFANGQVETIYVVGAASALQGVIVLDR